MSATPSPFLRLLARLPLRALHALGAVLGWAIYGASPTYRRHLRDNLAQAGYGGAVRRAAIAEAGRMYVEVFAIWLRSRAEVMAWVSRFEGWEHVEEARARGLGVVIVSPHIGGFEIIGPAVAERGLPITTLYRRPKQSFLQPLLEQGRGKGNMQLASADLAGVRELLAALKRGEAVGILPDQAPGAGEGEWVDFFGRPAYTMTLAAKLLRRDRVAGFLAFGERLARGKGYVIHFRPFPPALPGEPDMRWINRCVEALVRERPAQYLWGYNRYKVPRGAKPPPPDAVR